jgi:maleylacetate reductase
LEAFVYDALPQRVVFGDGTLAALGDELARLGVRRALVLSTPGQRGAAEAVARDLGANAAGVFARATMHTPAGVTDDGLEAARRLGADGVVSLGGGSTTGLGKAIALRTGLPQVAIPTTYAGSEATPILGETRDGRKVTQRDPRILPKAVLYDVSLTVSLPPALSVTSGLNAIAHGVEALYAQNRNPLTSQLALSGIHALVRSLPAIVQEPGNRAARSDALYGAWVCGTCLGTVGMALHHKACHVLGGSFELPHAETHSVILPHAVAYNGGAARELLAPIAGLLGSPGAAQGLWHLAQRLNAPASLRELGMAEAGLDRAAAEIAGTPYWNPRPVDQASIRVMLQNAFDGRPPSEVL